MKKSIFVIAIITLCLFAVACSTVNENTPAESEPPPVTSQVAPSTPPQSPSSAAPEEEEPELEPAEVTLDAPLLYTSDDVEAITISREIFDNLRANMFMGGDIVTGTGGDDMEWYRTVFGFLPNGVDKHFIDIVGESAFMQWTTLPRDRREPALISFIEYFSITMDDMINAQANAFSLPESEIEALINWARHGEDTGFADPGNEMVWADLVFSRSDFEALFSGDVNQLWTAFPGSGVVHNGKAYSPEWILQNIESAISIEQIPLGEIERVLSQASGFSYLLGDVIVNAESVLQAKAVG